MLNAILWHLFLFDRKWLELLDEYTVETTIINNFLDKFQIWR